MDNDILTNRHDILLLFEVTNGNPNGDPDAGNMPRIEPNSNCGLVSDVCLKRKIRNFVCEFGSKRERKDDENGFNILIQQGAVIETAQKRALNAVTNQLPKEASDQAKAEAAGKWLCREFFDVRTFGCVLSTGNDVFRGSAYGQVRGPVQITFGQSFHPITPIEITISVCAARSEDKPIEAQTGIQGHKHIVPYGLYYAKA
jgi:CRISPR-associated protein Csd2